MAVLGLDRGKLFAEKPARLIAEKAPQCGVKDQPKKPAQGQVIFAGSQEGLDQREINEGEKDPQRKEVGGHGEKSGASGDEKKISDPKVSRSSQAPGEYETNGPHEGGQAAVGELPAVDIQEGIGQKEKERVIEKIQVPNVVGIGMKADVNEPCRRQSLPKE